MPNWCCNYLAVEGSKDELEKFKKVASGKDRYGRETQLNEDAFLPYPEKFRELDRISHEWEEKADKLAKEKGFDNHYKYFNETKGAREAFVKANGEQPKDGFNQGGYEWCISNWGTKWGFCNPDKPREEEGKLIYVFDTAWGPALGLVAKMGEMFPKLRFENGYDEPGCCFKGRFVMENGECVENWSGDLISCPSCWNDIEECDCTQVMIKKAMDKDEWDDKQQKDMMESDEFKSKSEGSPDDEPENY